MNDFFIKPLMKPIKRKYESRSVGESQFQTSELVLRF